jgi:hypothetical protein
MSFGRNRAISVHMHASEIDRRRRLSALRRFTWNIATIGGLENAGFRGRERRTGAILTSVGEHHQVESRDERRDTSNLGQWQYQPAAQAREAARLLRRDGNALADASGWYRVRPPPLCCPLARRWVRFEKKASSRGWVFSGARVSLRLWTVRALCLRAHLDRIELPADWRDLLVRSRVTASRAEVVSAQPFWGAAIRYGSSPGAERYVRCGLRLNSNGGSHGEKDRS